MKTFVGAEYAKSVIVSLFGPVAETLTLNFQSPLGRWVEKHRSRGVPEFLLEICMICAGTLDDVSDSNDIFPLVRYLPITDYDSRQWWQYYKNPLESVLSVLPGFFPDAFTEKTSLEQSRELCEQRHPLICRAIRQAAPGFSRELTNRLAALANERFHLEPPDELEASKQTNSTAMLFLLQIIFPCLVEKGMMPDQILENALVNHDRESLEFLLRNDRRLFDHPDVAARIREEQLLGKGSVLETLCGDRSRVVHWSKLDIAARFTVIVMFFSEALSSLQNLELSGPSKPIPKFNAVHLAELFQAVGFDPFTSVNGQPNSNQAWSKRVSRLRKEWKLEDRFARIFVNDSAAG